MTGNDILKNAASLLGYTDRNGEINSLLTVVNRGTEIINQIALDLNIKKISFLSEKIDLSEKSEEIITYGVAMLMASNCGDTEKSDLFSRLYNMKRGSYKSEITVKKNVMPQCNGGG